MYLRPVPVWLKQVTCPVSVEVADVVADVVAVVEAVVEAEVLALVVIVVDADVTSQSNVPSTVSLTAWLSMSATDTPLASHVFDCSSPEASQSRVPVMAGNLVTSCAIAFSRAEMSVHPDREAVRRKLKPLSYESSHSSVSLGDHAGSHAWSMSFKNPACKLQSKASRTAMKDALVVEAPASCLH
jgi:hypothetical protein